MASLQAYSWACVELYSRLWAELDSLSLPVARGEASAAPGLPVPRGQILRLELHLLVDACETARWRLLLNAEQRQRLKSILQGVQLALDMDGSQASPDVITSAQNRLLDAVIAHCAYQAPSAELSRRAAS